MRQQGGNLRRGNPEMEHPKRAAVKTRVTPHRQNSYPHGGLAYSDGVYFPTRKGTRVFATAIHTYKAFLAFKIILQHLGGA